jgi:hypothetical protein
MKLICRGKGVKSQLLDDKDKILIPSLYIEFGFMKNFVKAVKKQDKCFEYLREIFPKFSFAESKGGIFIGPHNREVINDDPFEHLLTKTGKSAWLKFRAVCINLLGNVTAENYKDPVEDLINAHQTMGCSISLKIHLFTFPLALLPIEPGHSERRTWLRFHQDISTMEKLYVEVVTTHVS